MRLSVAVAIFVLLLSGSALAEVGGIWNGALTASDRCNSAPVFWSSPFTLAIVPVAGEQEVRGNAFFGAVPLYNDQCVVEGTLPMAVPFAGRVTGTNLAATFVFRGRPVNMTASISGASMSVSLSNADFSAGGTLGQTVTQIPPSPLSGFYAGTYNVRETVDRCRNLDTLTYSGPITASVVQTGIFLTGVGTAADTQRLVRDATSVCSTQPAGERLLQWSGQITGTALSGVLVDTSRTDQPLIPFSATIGAGTLSGRASAAGFEITFTLTRSTASAPSIALFAASPATVPVGEAAALTWRAENATSVIIDGIGRRPATGAIFVRPRTTTTYTLTAFGPGGTAEATTTVTVAPRPRVVVSAFPRGFIQRAGEGGGSDRFTLSNVGELDTTVTLTPVGNFFTVEPAAFPLAAGEHRTITISGLPQPAGPHVGIVAFSGDGVLAGGVPVRMLSATVPAGLVRARAAAAREEITTAAGETASGSLRFTNDGAVLLQGIAVSDVPWIVPDEGMITIPPGGTADVAFTVDSAKRPDSDAPVGALTGTISLVFPRGGDGSRMITNGEPSSSSVSVSLVYVVKPGVTPGSPPPLAEGELARFAPGLPNGGNLLLGNSLTSAALEDVQLYLQGGSTPQTTTIGQLEPNSSVALPGLVGSVFGSGTQSGSVQMRGVDVSKVSAAAMVSNERAEGGTFFASLPLFRSDRSVLSNAAMLLTGIEQSSSANTDIVIQETSGAAGSFRVDFLDASGGVITSSPTTAIGAFGFAHLTNLVPSGTSSVRIVNTASSGAVAGYAFVSNATTGDGWAVTDPAAGSGVDETFVVPILSAGVGASTILYTTNRGDEPVDVTVNVVGGGRGRRRAVTHGSSSGTLSPLQTSTTSITASKGWIRITAPAASLSAAARSIVTTGGSAYGSALPVVPLSDAMRVGDTHRFAGVDDTENVTSHLLLVEAAGQTAVARVTLQFTFSGGSLASSSARIEREYSLAADQALLLSDVAETIIGNARSSFGDLRDMIVDVELVSGEGRVMPFVQTIDHVSGDTIVRRSPT